MKKPIVPLKTQVAEFERKACQRAKARFPKPVDAASALGIDTSTYRRKLNGIKQ